MIDSDVYTNEKGQVLFKIPKFYDYLITPGKVIDADRLAFNSRVLFCNGEEVKHKYVESLIKKYSYEGRLIHHGADLNDTLLCAFILSIPQNMPTSRLQIQYRIGCTDDEFTSIKSEIVSKFGECGYGDSVIPRPSLTKFGRTIQLLASKLLSNEDFTRRYITCRDVMLTPIDIWGTLQPASVD